MENRITLSNAKVWIATKAMQDLGELERRRSRGQDEMSGPR